MIKINLYDILFYGSTSMSTVWDLKKLIPHCTYIKSPTDYKNCQQLKEPSKAIAEELMWWSETLAGNPFQWDK